MQIEELPEQQSPDGAYVTNHNGVFVIHNSTVGMDNKASISKVNSKTKSEMQKKHLISSQGPHSLREVLGDLQFGQNKELKKSPNRNKKRTGRNKMHSSMATET